jgi:dTDP-4-dehydrorhamnose reductase
MIVNAAGCTGNPNVDACEIHREECIRGNILWPINLEKRYKYFPIIHISSGCVYNGYKDGGWTEEDEPNFTGSFYSLTKAVVQKELNLKQNYLLRIRMPFEKEDNHRNYLTKLKTYPKLIDAENSLSFIEDIATVVLFFAKNKPEPGIYNVCNTGSITAREITDMMGLKKDWFTMDEFNASIKAPRSFCTLNTDKLTAIYPMRDVRTALTGCISP